MTQAPQVSVLWRRMDCPGHDLAQVTLTPAGMRVSGVAVFVEAGAPCRLDYVVMCGLDGRTRSAAVSGWVGPRAVRAAIDVDAEGRWRLDGVERPEVAGCIDVDLSFTPATNFLALHRLDLALGASAEVRSAWLTFPELTLEPLTQRYRRSGDRTYAYESVSPFAFTAELQVAESGLVTHYPGLWQAEALHEG